MKSTTGILFLMLGWAFVTPDALAANNANLYVAMGCGITKGSPPTVGDPWPAILKSYLGKTKTVVNAAKSGSRVGYGSYKVEDVLDAYKPGYLLILYGTNDIGIGNSIDYIIGELRVMIRAAKSRLTIPVVGTLPPVFNGLGSGMSTLNKRIKQLAASEGIQCADVAKAFNYNSSLIMYDGLHPTQAGQKLIAKTFLAAIKASKPITVAAPSISPSLQVHTSGQETGVINVTAASVTSWTATSAHPWVTIDTGSAGTGNGVVRYTVQPNTTAIYRTGRIQVAGKVFLIRQAGSTANLALASRGTAIWGANSGLLDFMIDGAISGYTASTGFGQIVAPNGSATLDLKSSCTIYGMSLLMWDLDSRTARYKVEASLDGINWSLIVDRTSGAWQSWQDIEIAPIRARYLRLTPTYSSTHNILCLVEWEVFGVPGAGFQPSSVILQKEAGTGSLAVSAPVGYAWTAITTDSWINILSGTDYSGPGTVSYSYMENANKTPRTAMITIDEQSFVIEQQGTYCNLALASRGSTISGNNGGLWNAAIDGVISGYTASLGYGYTFWREAANAPGSMVLDLQELCEIDRVRLLLWNLDTRTYRYRIEGSTNGVDWALLIDRTSGQYSGWQTLDLDTSVQVRYLRLTGTYNSRNKGFHVVEWEVYGSTVTSRRSIGGITARNVITSGSGEVLQPIMILSSAGEAPWTNQWAVADRDANTFWAGRQPDKGWWLALDYNSPVAVQNVEIDLAEDSSTNVLFLYSTNAREWNDLREATSGENVAAQYLWLIFPDDGSGLTPRIGEIRALSPVP